jgi:NAD(P)-dependent dehydrogenase (short-subunit alcohol dehydrogenase family)
MDLNAVSAIVTGGASGIGLASARRLAALGARVVVVDLNEEKGQAIAEELGGRFAKADVANEAEVQAAVDIASELAPLRALLNGAGIGSAMRTVDREGNPFKLETFEFVIRVNLIGSFNCLRLAAAAMAKS